LARVRLALGALTLLIAGCSTLTAQSPPPLPSPLDSPTSVVASSDVTPLAAMPSTPAAAAPSATALPPATLAPTTPPSTPTPVPAVPLHLSALLDPATPRAGEDFTVAVTVGNDGDRPAHGVYIATAGPWDRWTVLGIEPSGTFDKDAAGWHVISSVDVPPGETRTIQLHVRAEQPAQEQVTFAVREATPMELAR
jgi:uncharacterized protein DUF11